MAVGLCLAWSSTEPQTHPTDAEIRQKIVGTWLVDTRLANGNSVVGTEAILVSGVITSKATLTLGDKKEELEFTGKWQVKDGYLIETVEKSNTKRIPIGKITRDKVITLNDKTYVYETESGKTVTRERSK